MHEISVFFLKPFLFFF